MLLHHSPLPYLSYAGDLSRRDGRLLELTNSLDLLTTCKNDVDVFLFGHTHAATARTFEGFVMVDAGTTMATLPRAPRIPTLQAVSNPKQDHC